MLGYFVALLVVSRIYDPLTTSLDNLTAILATDIPCRRMDEICPVGTRPVLRHCPIRAVIFSSSM